MRSYSSSLFKKLYPRVGLCLFLGSTSYLFLLASNHCSPIVTTALSIPQQQRLSSRHGGTTTTLPQRHSSILHSSKKGADPLSSLWDNMAGAILKRSNISADPERDEALQSLGTPWKDIQSTLHKLQTPKEREFRTNLEKGYGVGSPLHKVRLYDESNKEQDVRVTLYRDSASWCPYCQKVWTMLEEKKIPYRVEKINMRCYGDKPRSFLQVQPNGNIPVAVIDGKVYGQSNDIMYALEELFPDNRSLSVQDGARGNEMLRLERQLFSTWLMWLTGGRGKQDFIDTLTQVEAALNQSSGPFFMGKDVTIVDLMFVPFLERMCASLLYFKGFVIRVAPGIKGDYPAVNQWFDAMETLESYQLTKSDYYTHSWDLPPQLGGCVSEDGSMPFQRAIDGERRLTQDERRLLGTTGVGEDKPSWALPLEPHNGGVEPDWEWAATGDAARREAVERLSANHEAIVKFAARGAGRKGIPPAMAELSDPNAVPNEAVIVGVDSILQTICMAMLEGVDKHHDTMRQIANIAVSSGDKEYADGLVASLLYLRDRVGVPRDMKLPAARELRAHLYWAVETILQFQDAE